MLITEETLTDKNAPNLTTALRAQPPGGEVPIVIVIREAKQFNLADRFLSELPNITLLERPTSIRSVISAVQAALRQRERQYQFRRQVNATMIAQRRASDLQQELELAITSSGLGTFHSEYPFAEVVLNARAQSHLWLRQEATIDFEKFYAHLHVGDRQAVRGALESSLAGEQRFDQEYRTVAQDGRVRWIRGTGRAHFDDQGHPVRIDGTTQDVTERKLVEDKLRAGE